MDPSNYLRVFCPLFEGCLSIADSFCGWQVLPGSFTGFVVWSSELTGSLVFLEGFLLLVAGLLLTTATCFAKGDFSQATSDETPTYYNPLVKAFDTHDLKPLKGAQPRKPTGGRPSNKLNRHTLQLKNNMNTWKPNTIQHHKQTVTQVQQKLPQNPPKSCPQTTNNINFTTKNTIQTTSNIPKPTSKPPKTPV